jgi:uncharacterized protein YjdB
VEPDNVPDKSITWSSSNKTIASVNQEGKVTGMRLGKAVITAEAVNGKKARCVVNVHLPWPIDIQLDQPTLSLFIGESETLTPVLQPESSDRTITWSSSDETIATVSEDGTVNALSFGGATITATTAKGLQATCALTVNKKAPTGVQIAPEVYLAIGYTEKLTATVLPFPGASQEVTWSSSNPAIISINAATGEATGVALGSAVITATAVDDQSITATCAATVSAMNNLTLTGYTGESILLTYTDNSTMTLPVHDGQAMLVHSSRTIKSLTPAGGSPILIGRKADSDVSLKFNGTALAFRDAVDGFVPIGTYAEFQLIKTALGGSYRQEADLDLMNESWTPISIFSGTFTGDRHTIANLYVSRGTFGDNGLFGRSSNATIQYVNIVSGSVSGKGASAGILGYMTGGLVFACSNNADVSGEDNNLGGIVGFTYGTDPTIIACRNSGNITNTEAYNGGIVGYVGVATTIIACYNTGTITGKTMNGGIVGAGGNITASYNTGTIATDAAGSWNSIGNSGVACYTIDLSAGHNNNATVFSGAAWPSTSANAEWGVGDGSGSGKYWKSLGNWNGGSPTYPKLFFE